MFNVISVGDIEMKNLYFCLIPVVLCFLIKIQFAAEDEFEEIIVEVPQEIAELITAVTSRPWRGKDMPPRPQLTGEVKQGIVEELTSDPERLLLYAKLNSKNRNTTWFEGISELTEKKAMWCLVSGLCHSSDDVQIKCARALSKLKDAKIVPFMLVVAKAFAVFEGGSENAALHGIFQHELANGLNTILGTSVKLRKYQDPEVLKKGISVWRAALSTNIVWSKMVNGLQIRLSVKQVFPAGQPLAILGHIRNAGKKPCELSYALVPHYWDVLITPERGGEPIKWPRQRSIQVGKTVMLEPGEEKTIRLQIKTKNPLTPGRYIVTATCQTAGGQGKAIPCGAISSEPIEIAVRSVNAYHLD